MKRIFSVIMICSLMVNPYLCAADAPEASEEVLDVLTGIVHNLYGIGASLCSLTVTLGKCTLWGTSKTLSFVNHHPLISLGIAVSAYAAWKKFYPKKTQVIAGRVSTLPNGIVLIEDFTR